MTRTVVVTGANRGVGLALTKEYLARDFQVLAVCRQVSQALANTHAQVLEGVDMGVPDSIPAISDALGDRDIHMLINNAAIFGNEVLGRIDYDTMLEKFMVNALAPLRVTECVLHKLKAGSKVGMISSRMGSIADNKSGGRYGYRMSKAALNAACMSMSKDLYHKGIAVGVLHPGFVQTDMVSYRGDISPQTAATRLAQRMDELTIENSGSFWHSNGDILPW